MRTDPPKWGHFIAFLLFVLHPYDLKACSPAPRAPSVAAFEQELAETKAKDGSSGALQLLSETIRSQDTDGQVRKFAIAELGRTDLPSATETSKDPVGLLLMELAEEIGPRRGDSQDLYVQVWKRRTFAIRDPADKELLWMAALEGGSHDTPLGVRYWAADSLCSKGSKWGLGSVESFILENTSTNAAPKLALCRKQVELIQAANSPIEAYDKVLRTEDRSSMEQLHSWALRELDADGSREAQMVIADFVRRLQDADWVGSGNARYALRRFGWTDKDFAAAGLHLLPPWVRNPPRLPPDSERTVTDRESDR